MPIPAIADEHFFPRSDIMLRRGVYDRDWIPQCGNGNVYNADRACAFADRGKRGLPHRTTADIYHDKLMALLEELARAERTDSDPRHGIEYARARKRAVDLYRAGKDPDPRLDTHNMQFPMENMIEDEMYGCSSCSLDVPPDMINKIATDMADPYASPVGLVIPQDPPNLPTIYSTGYEI